jgi:hypothetical protein
VCGVAGIEVWSQVNENPMPGGVLLWSLGCFLALCWGVCVCVCVCGEGCIFSSASHRIRVSWPHTGGAPKAQQLLSGIAFKRQREELAYKHFRE